MIIKVNNNNNNNNNNNENIYILSSIIGEVNKTAFFFS